MADKDRLSDKLRGKEKAEEDRYFAQHDRELLDKMKQTQPGAAASQGFMQCPKCGMKLAIIQLHDVAVEECPSCKGLWLDRGELETLSQRENEGWVGRFIRRSITS